MSDNTILPGTGETYASVDRGGVKTQNVLANLAGGPDTDSFGRLRVSNTTTLFASKLIYGDKQPLFWDEALESGAGITSVSPTIAKPYVDFQSTLNTAGLFTRQTFRRFNHQPGKSQILSLSAVIRLSGGGTGVINRLGYFDDDNGVFFLDNEGVVSVCVRSNVSGSPVDSIIAQTAWNLDRLDGSDNNVTNPSGILADWTNTQIFVEDFQWLAVGRIRFGVVIGGALVYVHEVNTSNIDAEPWSSTPNLPIRMQMQTSSSSPASSMRNIGTSLLAEGGADFPGSNHSHATVDHINANTANTWYAVLGLRLKTTHIGGQIIVTMMSMVAETNDKFEWALMLNPTVAGTFTFADHADSDSAMQEAIGDTVTSTGTGSLTKITGGDILARGFGAAQSAVTPTISSSMGLGVSIAGVRDELVLAVRPLSAGADIQAAVVWRETL